MFRPRVRGRFVSSSRVLNRRLVIGFAVLVSLLFGQVAPAQAITLMTIQGTVRDPAGTPLANVAVRDGTQVVYTDAGGQYVLEEGDISSYQVSASRIGLNSTNRVVDPVDALASVDFTMTYTLGLGLNPSVFNSTAVGSIAVSVNSYAPTSSCVLWTANGITETLSLWNAVPGGNSTWTSTKAVSGLAESSYPTSAVAVTCDAGVPLTNSNAKSYVVDNTAPVVKAISPWDTGNVGVLSVPIIASAVDSLAGPASASVSVTDLNTGVERNPATTYSADGTIRSPELSVEAGHSYRTILSAADRAGNTASLGFTFSAMRVEAPSVSATIPATGSDPAAIGSTTFTFSDVPLRIDQYVATFIGSSGHPGMGYVPQQIDLREAKVRLYLRDLLIAEQAAPSSWGTRTALAQIHRFDNSVNTMWVQALKLTIPSLTFTTNLVVDRAEIVMDTMTTPVPGDALCADVTSACGAAFPSPDPLPFLIKPSDGGKLQALSERADAQTNADTKLALGLDIALPPMGVGLIYAQIEDPSDAHWTWMTVSGSYNNLAYPALYPLYSPVTHKVDCARMSCATATSSSSTSFADGGRCVRGDSSPDKCSQWVNIRAEEAKTRACLEGGNSSTQCTNYPRKYRHWSTVTYATEHLDESGNKKDAAGLSIDEGMADWVDGGIASAVAVYEWTPEPGSGPNSANYPHIWLYASE